MNIKEAKEQIKNAMTAYFTKDEYGEYEIPIEKQRPVFLMGPPGIGKTAIMEQVASELGVGLVSYSMTHHTRQSALGLPFIEKKNYGGKEYSISEYTMSEIIASVYELMEKTGVREGILFLDEINCVSETLAPSMLQFLQYKIFGRHRVPSGWIVVTAGNPPEYNNSVREFDIVTWDRLKRIDVEPNYDVWKEYAYVKSVHPAILTYLDIKKNEFYRIETTVDGKSFVTARGWSDLSDMIRLYEKNKLTVDEKLIAQYLQNRSIAKSFAVYYDLFNKYRSDYQVDKILDGKAEEEIYDRAKKAKFDERLSLLGLIIDKITEKARGVCALEQSQVGLFTCLRGLKTSLALPSANPFELLNGLISEKREALEKGLAASTLSDEDKTTLRAVIAALEEGRELLAKEETLSSSSAFDVLKKYFDKRTALLKKLATDTGKQFSHIFEFCEKSFGDGQELLILVTELTMNCHTARFISRYGCDEYYKHNKELFFYERQKEIISTIEMLDLD